MKTTVLWDVAPCSLVKFTDVSGVLAASIIGKLLSDYTAHPRRQSSSYSPPREPEISTIMKLYTEAVRCDRSILNGLIFLKDV
jgi:hypothetical protein